MVQKYISIDIILGILGTEIDKYLLVYVIGPEKYKYLLICSFGS